MHLNQENLLHQGFNSIKNVSIKLKNMPKNQKSINFITEK